MSDDLARLIVDTHKRAAWFANDMRRQGIHVGLGNPPVCVTCGQPWPCDNEKGEDDAGQDEEPDVIEITDDDLLTILRRPLARADDDWPTVTVDTMALRLALDAWDRAKTERDDIDRGAIAEGATQRATIWRLTSENEQLQAKNVELTLALDVTAKALQGFRATVLHEADSIAGRPLTQAEADLCARTLRTAAGQEASDR